MNNICKRERKTNLSKKNEKKNSERKKARQIERK